MYPLSSKIEMNKNKKAIWGMKITIPPIPDTIPSATKSVTFPPPGKVTLTHSAKLAKALGLKKISVIEFGCAGGKGLIKLEKYAQLVEKSKEKKRKV
jgi:hypothetical protein